MLVGIMVSVGSALVVVVIRTVIQEWLRLLLSSRSCIAIAIVAVSLTLLCMHSSHEVFSVLLLSENSQN